MTPLNGKLTHPLTSHALSVLKELSTKSKPAQELNPGLRNRLLREDLIEYVLLPSPYAIHKGARIDFVCITDVGLDRLQ